MAHLIGVGESLYSMYEIGLRELPLRAMIRRNEIHRHLETPAARSTFQKHDASRQPATRQHIENLLQQNKLQQLSIARKIESALQKRSTAARQLHLGGLNDMKGKAIPAKAVDYIKSRGAQQLGEKPAALLFDLEIRQKVLAFEAGLLEEALKTLGITLTKPTGKP